MRLPDSDLEQTALRLLSRGPIQTQVTETTSNESAPVAPKPRSKPRARTTIWKHLKSDT